MLDDTEDEYRRLLYVAMTRAADRLIVGGYARQHEHGAESLLVRSDPHGPWQFRIAVAGDRDGQRAGEALFAARGCRRSTAAAAAPAAGARVELPSWLRGAAPAEPAADNLLRPSDPGTNEGHPVRSGEWFRLRARAMLRGTLVHRLLQSLPDVAVEGRRDAALRYLARNAGDWTEGEREALAERMLALIGDPRFAPVFAPGSRAEVSIAGRLERPEAAGAGFGPDRPAGGDVEPRS